MVYSQEVSLGVSKSQVLSVLGDPFSFTGIVGHINILQVFDKEQARYVTPESLREPVNDFLVLYVFGTPDTKLSIMKGYMEGPKPIPGGISYSGRTDDDKMEWKMEFYITEGDDTSRLRTSIEFTYKSGALDKLLGRSPFQLAEHILTGHIIPYFKFYQRGSSVKMPDTLSWEEKERIEDELPVLATKIRDSISKIDNGAVIIVGKNLRAIISVRDKKPLNMKMIKGNQVISGNEVLARLILEQGRGILLAYNVDTDELLNIVAEKVLREVSTTIAQKL